MKIGNLEILDILKKNLKKACDNKINSKILYLVIFTICLNFLFIILCYPFLNGLMNFVIHTRQMVTSIPVEGIITLKTFEKLVVKHIKQ